MDAEEAKPNRYLEEGNTEAILGLAVRVRALEESQAYGNRMVEELRKELAIVDRTCTRIEAIFATYEGFLKEAVQNDAFYKKIRDEVVSGVAKSAVWAVIAGLCIVIWYAVKAYAVYLLNGGR